MSLPTSWVDSLFGRLSLRYGNAFLRQWQDASIDAVKADWADVLDGVSGEAIGYALRYLPEAPPNAIKFRDQCRRMPAPAAIALPPPDVKPDPERLAAALAGLKREPAGGSPAQECADRIMFLVGDRGRMSSAQRHQMVAMWGMLTDDQRARAARFVPKESVKNTGLGLDCAM